MDTSENKNVKQSEFTLGDYLITYDSNITTETYSCADYYGIIFYTQDAKYDVVHNFHLGARLITNKKDGSWSDIPFKPATFGFLPTGITVQEINNGNNRTNRESTDLLS